MDATLTAHAHETTDHTHHASFLRTYIFSTDHKMIAKQFMVTALLFLFIGGAFALFIRWQLAYPGKPIPVIGTLLPSTWVSPEGAVTADFYAQLLTMHGSVMIFAVIIPLLVGMIGNFCVPLMIGADDMAFPTINMISFWMFPVAGALMMAGFWVEGGSAAAGWTGYPPLSALASTGQTLWIVALFIVGFSSILGALNYITTVLNMRAPGMGLFQMPMTVWAIFITAIIIIIGTPVLASALAMLFMDNFLHTSFFLPANLVAPGKDLARTAGGGQPLLWQHLFWFYSHPAVYIMILPGMGVVSDVLAVFSRKPLFGYKAMVFAIIAIAFLGIIVWGHHMFQSGMNPLLGTTFMISTMVIAVPSAIKTFNWLGTMWRGQMEFTTPMLNAVAFVSMFVIGGLSGIFMASTPVDVYIHDTYFIVGHIHYVLFGGSLFAVFAGLTYWWPKMTGRMMHEGLGKLHFWITFVSFNFTFFPMHILGVGGMMRRIYDPTVYDFLKPFQPMNEFITVNAIILGFAQFILVAALIHSLVKGRAARRNPWRANTLEWEAPSPPPHGNFDKPLRVYRGPYEYSSPESVQDYLPQTLPPDEVTRRMAEHLAREKQSGSENG
ncbi:MAG: cbb3-type cytochrome c oxidase subunit I [Ignavibacteriae bacterium]|nr:cbb3-type cytochrome c oxidase subunit I [Ignavibacteriota bacterium]